MTIRNSAPRKKQRWFGLLVTVVLGTLFVVSTVFAGAVSNDAGFQGDDGNLVDDGAGIDWNSFSPVTYTGQQADKDLAPWHFTGLSDAAATTSDSAFAGGVKQDTNCAALTTAKAANKTDLRSIYIADARVGGDVYLALAWVRIPQNTTSPSAHVGFEFNQGDTSCPGGSPLISRIAGDILVVYDFEGSSTSAPVLTLRRWVTSGPCEVSSNSAPCWGPATNLTAIGFAEARVNTFGTVQDAVGPSSPTLRPLGTNEFGEAIINLTDAIVAAGGSADDCAAFGNAYGVSRSSGNSGTAQMKDLVGPANVDINTCAGLTITKVTDPAGDDVTEFGFTISPNPGEEGDDTFSLMDGESETFTNIQEGTYTVTEDDPSDSDYALTDITCVTDDGSTWDLVDETDLLDGVEINLAAGDDVTCTFTNTLQTKDTTTTTQPSVIATLHDSASVTGDNDPSGKVTFKLWDNDECDGEPIHEEEVDLVNGEASTIDGFGVTEEGTWYWTAHYGGDTLNNPSDSECGDEVVSIDLTPDPPADE